METPRPYQQQCIDRAIEQNTVVCLPTGTGKTLVAAKVIEHFLPSAASLFVVPTKALVKQQAMYCRKHCCERVAELCGLEMDSWDKLCWETCLTENRIFVGTPDVFKNAIDKAFLSPEAFGLVVLDECHHAAGKHPMAMIMRRLQDSGVRPRILGLTASFLSGALKRKKDAENAKMNLELLLDASFICPEVPAETLQDPTYHPVPWDSTSFTESFEEEVAVGLRSMAEHLGEAAELKDFRKLGPRMRHVLQELGREALDIYLSECVVPQLKQQVQQLELWQNCPEEERQKIKMLLEKLPLLVEWSKSFRNELMSLPSVAKAPPVSPKTEALFELLKGLEGKGIVFVEQVATTVPLAQCIKKHLQLQTEPVYGEMTRSEQQQCIQNFKEGKTMVVVATNTWQEGVDVSDCKWVVRFNEFHTTKDHIQGSGRARASAAEIYYFQNDHREEESKQRVLTSVAKDQRLSFTEEERRRLRQEVQSVPGVYPYAEEGAKIHLFNGKEIVQAWYQQVLGRTVEEVPTPDGFRDFSDADVERHWQKVLLEEVVREAELKTMKANEKHERRRFYALAVWLRKQNYLDEHNEPSVKAVKLAKEACKGKVENPAKKMRLNNTFAKAPQAGKTDKQALLEHLQQAFKHEDQKQLVQFESRMEETEGWVVTVTIHLPQPVRQSSSPCPLKKQAEHEASRKALEKLKELKN